MPFFTPKRFGRRRRSHTLEAGTQCDSPAPGIVESESTTDGDLERKCGAVASTPNTGHKSVAEVIGDGPQDLTNPYQWLFDTSSVKVNYNAKVTRTPTSFCDTIDHDTPQSVTHEEPAGDTQFTHEDPDSSMALETTSLDVEDSEDSEPGENETENRHPTQIRSATDYMTVSCGARRRLSGTLRRLSLRSRHTYDVAVQTNLVDPSHLRQVRDLNEQLQRERRIRIDCEIETEAALGEARQRISELEAAMRDMSEHLRDLRKYKESVTDSLMTSVERQNEAMDECAILKKEYRRCQEDLELQGEMLARMERKVRTLTAQLADETEDRERAEMEAAFLETEKEDLLHLVNEQRQIIEDMKMDNTKAQTDISQYKDLYMKTKMQCSATLGNYLNEMNDVLDENRQLMEVIAKSGSSKALEHLKEQASKYCHARAECNRLSQQVDLLMAQTAAQDLEIESLQEHVALERGLDRLSSPDLAVKSRVTRPSESSSGEVHKEDATIDEVLTATSPAACQPQIGQGAATEKRGWSAESPYAQSMNLKKKHTSKRGEKKKKKSAPNSTKDEVLKSVNASRDVVSTQSCPLETRTS